MVGTKYFRREAEVGLEEPNGQSRGQLCQGMPVLVVLE